MENVVCARRTVRRGDTLFNAGDAFRALYAVRSGFFKTSVLDGEGREQVTGFFMGGELLGMEGAGSGRYNGAATALEDSEVCVMPFQLVEDMARQIPALQRGLHVVLSREIVRQHGVMMLLGSRRAEERLAAFLLNLSQRFLRRNFSGREFHLRMTREEIGSYVSLKLETVSRLLSQFEKTGLISVRHRHVRLLDLEGLQGFVNASETFDLGQEAKEQPRQSCAAMLRSPAAPSHNASAIPRLAGNGALGFLSQLPLLQGVPADSLARLAAAASPLARLEKGVWLFRQADGCSGFYVVASGSISLAYHSPHGTEKIIEIVRPGESFCEAFLFVERTWPVSARALEETAVLSISRLAVREEMGREPALARALVAGLARRLHALRDDLGANDLQSGAARFVAYLLEKAGAQSGPFEIELPRKGDLASRLSMSAEHFSRILRRLHALGLLQVSGRLVRVSDASRLRAYCR